VGLISVDSNMSHQDTRYFKQMEVDARRGVGEALHPDQCPKLCLHGVDFAIPPRGLRVVPQFDAEGKASLDMAGVEDWPELSGLLARAGEATKERTLTIDLDDSAGLLCDLMGLARKAMLKQYALTDPQIAELLATKERTLTIDLDDSAGLLCDLMGLARKAMLKQYALTDPQIAELLAFETDKSPEWVQQLLRWAHGLPMDFGPIMEALSQPETPQIEIAPEPPRKRWKFWKR